MLRLTTLAWVLALLSPFTLPAQDAGCTTAMLQGYYGAHSDGWTLRDTQGQEILSPRASIVVMHADGEGNIAFSRELLILKSEVDGQGNVIHDGSHLIDHHDFFDQVSYEVLPDCRVIIRYHSGDTAYEIVGILVDGGREVFGVSANDSDVNTHTVASFTMRRIVSDQDGVDSRLDALEAQAAAVYDLLRRIATRLSIAVE